MARGSTARLFAAIAPPRELGEELAAWGRAAASAMRGGARASAGASVRVLAPEAMHVTLCFLGARPVGEIDALALALERCAVAPLGELALGAPLWLPARAPRTLALDVRDTGTDGSLAALHEAVADAFSQTVSWEPEQRRFRAHLTVARLGRGRSRGRGGSGAEGIGARQTILPAAPARTFTPRAVTLYRSWLEPDRARYEALATRAL